MVESRISHELNQVQLLAQDSLPKEISSKCLELGPWGLGDLVLRHGEGSPPEVKLNVHFQLQNIKKILSPCCCS